VRSSYRMMICINYCGREIKKKYLLPVQVARDVGNRPSFLPEQPSIFYQAKDIFSCGNGGGGRGMYCVKI
jgi:hypothetical protein